MNLTGNSTKISVIIPVYNVEDYLRECLDSIVNQTLKDIEIICINDGSTDGSLKILEEYASKDDRITIINQENQGQGIARNKGIEKARGEYISFIDPDDFIDLNTYEYVYNKFKETGADIAQYDYTTCRENGKPTGTQAIKKRAKKLLKINLKNNQIFSYRDVKVKNLAGLRLGTPDKIYSAKFIKENNIRFAPNKHGEDHLFSIGAYLLADKILYLNKYFYHYRTRKNSSVHTATDDNFCIFENVKLLKEFLESHGLYNEYEQAYNDYIIHAFALHYTNIPEVSMERYLKQCSEILSEEDYKRFLKETEPKFTFWQRIFSVKNHRINGIKHKFVWILGLRFSFIADKNQQPKFRTNDSKDIKLLYYTAEKNFGDLLNLDIFHLFSNRTISQASSKECDYVAIGSLLDSFYVPKYKLLKIIKFRRKNPVIVWGSGFINPIEKNKTVMRKMDIRAVRGYLTLNRLQNNKCIKIADNVAIGDPGILISKLFKPKSNIKKYKLGIIPHYLDRDNPLLKNIKVKNSVIIDISLDTQDFIDKLAQCEVIVSSSLHGLISADSFLIPNKRIIVSNKLKGGNYKFEDYYSAFNRESDFIDLSKDEIDDGTLEDIIAQYKVNQKQVSDMQTALMDVIPIK